MTTQKQVEATRLAYIQAKQSAKCRGKFIMRRVERTALVMRGSDALVIPKNKSKTVVIATENAVRRMDPDRGEILEVLLMNGIEWRDPTRRQLPIVDSHNRDSVRNIFGSIRNLRIDGRKLVGEVVWAGDDKSQEIARKWQDDHLRDFSVTAAPIEILEVRRGETWRNVAGPADIVVKWQPLDASIVASGADWATFDPPEQELSTEQVAIAVKQWWAKKATEG